ncbi:hypothetical protein [Pleionea sp. CnH1-48]|uniref:hypothetical protein n=1 Tax=Pleionea sp. CnH1-48 TaxID=2954494 RepID=UPI002097E0F9|nr:hypothetical protein [Pleionea sp. CnH1-48]MCO7227283.1 hypothetical protein [Pleionea sp. CnH1-48]
MRKYIIKIVALVCLFPLCIQAGNNEGQQKKSDQPKVVIDSYDWSGDIPTSKVVVVKNPYGNIRSRNHIDPKVFLSAAYQTVGEKGLIPSFDIKEANGQLEIEVVYPSAIKDKGGKWLARTDVSVVFPPEVSIYAETDFGMIKIDKSSSNVWARSQSGKILLATTGVFNAQTDSGKLALKLRGFKAKGESVATSQSGPIQVEVFSDMDVSLNAQTSGLLTYDGKEQKDKKVALELGNKTSLVTLSSLQGDVSVKVVPPPALVKSVKPSSTNVDIRTLPKVKPWKAGQPIVEQNDGRSRAKNR